MARGGMASHGRVPDWQSTPNWLKGMPGLHGGKRSRSHTLDPRKRTAPAVGEDVKQRATPRSKNQGTKARW